MRIALDLTGKREVKYSKHIVGMKGLAGEVCCFSYHDYILLTHACAHGLCPCLCPWVMMSCGFCDDISSDWIHKLSCFQPQQNVRTVFPHMPRKTTHHLLIRISLFSLKMTEAEHQFCWQPLKLGMLNCGGPKSLGSSHICLKVACR